MPLRHTPPPTPTKAKGSDSAHLDLCSAAFGVRLHCHDVNSGESLNKKSADEVGPHIEFLQALGGVGRSYLPTRAGGSRCPHEQRLRGLQEKARQRIEGRGQWTDVPTGARVVDISDVLRSQTYTEPIKDFKEFLDRAGVAPGKTSYLTFPDGTVSAVRRRVLNNNAAVNEVLWVESFAAVGHLHNLKVTDRGAQLVLPVPYDIRGFFDPDVRIAVMPMIEKQNGRPRSEWREESIVTLEAAAHELEHGRGGGEYQACAAGDAYLYRTKIVPISGTPQRRLESISRGWYSAAEYSAAVGDAMRDQKRSTIIAPARLPDERVEDVPLSLLASVSVGSFISEDALKSDAGADVLSYGLRAQGAEQPNGRRVCARREDRYTQNYWMVGEPLSDRILAETSSQEKFSLRIVVGEAISYRIAHETLRLAEIFQSEQPTSEMVGRLANEIANTLEPGDVHLAVRDYVHSRGGAAFFPHGDETIWINSLSDGLALRSADSVTIFFASPIHRGAALRIPMPEGCSSGRIAERVRVFARDVEAIDTLFARRPGKSLWESIAVPHVGKGARYLFPALEGA